MVIIIISSSSTQHSGVYMIKLIEEGQNSLNMTQTFLLSVPKTRHFVMTWLECDTKVQAGNVTVPAGNAQLMMVVVVVTMMMMRMMMSSSSSSRSSSSSSNHCCCCCC